VISKGEKMLSSATGYREYSEEEMKKRAHDFYEEMRIRRSVRKFSNRPVPRSIIEDCLRTACSAPSGANLQPWHFCVIFNPEVKRKIRVSDMLFLNGILKLPSHARAFLILVVGYPDPEATVPGIGKKPLDEVATFI
jgi:RNase P protein component